MTFLQKNAYFFSDYKAYRYFYALALTTLFVYFSACNKVSRIDEHPDFVNAIYKRMDTVQAKYLDQGFDFIDSAFNALPNPGLGDVFAKDSIKISKYYYTKNDYKKFNSLLDSLIELTKTHTDEQKYAQRYAITLYMKGGYYLAMKRYNESMYYISMAESIVLKLVKNKCSVANYAAVKAYLLFAQEKYLESAASFRTQSHLSLFNCSDDSSRLVIDLQRCQNNVALSYLRAGVLDSASWYQKLALHTIVSNENKYPHSKNLFANAKAVIYGDQAEVLALQEQYPGAEALYRKSIAGTSAEDMGYTQSTQARLADAYLKDSKPDSAHLVLDQLKHSLDTLYNEKQLISWYKSSVKYYEQTKQLGTAFKYQQQYKAIKDSVEARDKKFISVDITKEFENLELKYSNDILQKEDKLKTIYLGIAIAIFVTLTAILIFIWYNLKRTRKLHQQMKQKNQDMQAAFASLEQSHQENNRIIRIVAHDLKNPISTINNLVFSILRKELSEDLKEIFELIKKACSNSMVLINDALLQKKKAAAIRKELVDMKMLLEYCVGLLQAKATEKNQHINLHAEDVSIMLNRQKMWRVVSNIVNNAIKFSPEHTAIDIKLQRKENSILLSVQDKGIGIPENLKDKIFTLSPEASRLGTCGEESYGLGLSISQKIIEEHQGKIWFDSYQGQGSVFYVELPCPN